MEDISIKMEEVFDAAQRVQDLVMDLGALVARTNAEPAIEEAP